MTKEEIQYIHEACELIETGKSTYTCVALKFGAVLHSYRPNSSHLAYRYCSFYNNHHTWYRNDDGSVLTKEQRIIMLLLFAEAEQDVL